MPRVSVCIPAYNAAPYIGGAIQSVLDQDYTDYELVVCDNASSDQTPAISRSYDSPRMRYLRFEEKTNQAASFNRCLAHASGEFITILHADDQLLQGFLADRVHRLTSNQRAAFVFGAVEVMDAAGSVTRISSEWPEDKFVPPTELLSSLLHGCIVSPPSVMVRAAAARQAGPFRTDLTWGHDWEWTMRLAELGGACYASKPLGAYRVHDESGTAAVLKTALNGPQERLILTETLARLTARDNRFRDFARSAFHALCLRHMYFAEIALLHRRRAVALNNLWYASRSDPAIVSRPTFWAMVVATAAPIRWYRRYRGMRNAVTVPASWS